MEALTIVKHYYEAFNDQRWTEMLALVSDDIRHYPNEGTLRIGKDLFKSFLSKMDESYSEELKDIHFYTTENESKVAVEFVVHGKYLKGEEGLPEAKGQTYVLPAAAFLEVKDNVISSIRTYYNLSEWIEKVS